MCLIMTDASEIPGESDGFGYIMKRVAEAVNRASQTPDPIEREEGEDWHFSDEHAAALGKGPRQPCVGRRCIIRDRFDGLFNLWELDDGTFRAELGDETFYIAGQLERQQPPTQAALSMALSLLPSTPGIKIRLTQPRSPQYYIPICHALMRCQNLLQRMSDEIGSDLEILTDHSETKTSRLKAKKRLHLAFDDAIEQLFLGEDYKPHDRKKMVPYTFEDGTEKKVSLAWLILRLAPSLVEQTQALPTKKALRKYVVERYPAAKLSDGTWTKAWKEAGDFLPEHRNW